VVLLYRCSGVIKCWLLGGGGCSAFFVLFHALGGVDWAVWQRASPLVVMWSHAVQRSYPHPLY
jgi:hypothetical protein